MLCYDNYSGGRYSPSRLRAGNPYLGYVLRTNMDEVCTQFTEQKMLRIFMGAQIATARLNLTASISSVFPDTEHSCFYTPSEATSSDLLRNGTA